MVKVYTRDHCPNCEKLKKLLDDNGIEYAVCDVEIQEHLEAVKRARLVNLPIVEKNGIFVDGNATRILDFIREA